MSFALVRKELREHGVVLLLAFALDALMLTALTSRAADLGRMAAAVRFAAIFGPLNALILANRLFAREYGGSTQLFLEVMPISRARVFATKWMLGWTWIGGITLVAWWSVLHWQRRVEVISSIDALGVLSAIGATGLAFWSFGAMAGMLGRYRHIAWLIATILLGTLYGIAEIPVGELPIVQLFGQDIEMAHGWPRTGPLLTALAIAIACTGCAAALALVGSGALASALAKRMTTRERAFVVGASIVAVAAIGMAKREHEKPPFELDDAQYARARSAVVGVMRTKDLDPAAARTLGEQIAGDVDSLVAALGLRVEPSVFVLPQRGLDRRAMSRADLAENDGIVLRAAPDAPRDQLRALVLHSLLLDATHGRAGKEDRHVLLDGVSAAWALRDDEAGRGRAWLRAAAAPIAISERTLLDWEATSERLGECISDAVAFATIDTLQHALGTTHARSLLRELFAEPRDDMRVLFETSPRERLERAGLPWAALAAKIERERRAVQAREQVALRASAGLRARVISGRDRNGANQLRAQLAGAPAFWVRYALLTPWARAMSALPRIDARDGRPVTIPLSPPRGARVLAVVEADDADLDCPVRVLAERITLP